MIIPSTEFREELFNGNRKYIISAYLYSSSGTFVLTNAQVWEKTCTFEDTVNSDDVFDVGNAIINKFTIGLNNIDEQYSGIVFTNAVIIPSVGLLVDGQAEMLQKGIFIVDDCKFDGSIIKLTCLDLMERFDRPYDTDLTFPATLLQIVQDACSKCAITINNVSYPIAPQTFPNYDYSVAKKPESDTVTYREVLSWCAQIAGCFARVSRLGALEFKWFNTAALADLNDNLDGGVFDGGLAPFTIPTEYFDTTEGMTQVVSEKQYNTVTHIAGASWFVINNAACPDLYVCSNSWISPTYTSNTSSFPSSATVAWGYNVRSQDMTALYRQEFVFNGKRGLKIRWEGYGRHNYSTDAYRTVWELFLIEGGYSVIKSCTKASSYGSGTYRVKVASKSTNYTAATGGVYKFNPDGATGTVTPYQSGDSADGGSFHSGGDTFDGGSFTDFTDVDFINECFSTDVAVDATVVEGVKITYAVEDSSGTHVRTATEGNQDGFKVLITDNDFIASDQQAILVCQTIKNALIGMRFYRADASHLSDPCIEAGDVGMIRNFRGNYFPIIISRTKFGISVSQNTSSNAETDSRNTSYRDMPAISVDTNIPDINIPTDLIVITDPNGDDWAIYVDTSGNISTVKVPKYIYYYVEPKLDYFPGDLIDVSEAVVHAVYNDGTEIDVTSACTFDPPAGFEIPDISGTFQIVATWIFTPGQSVGGGS